MLVFIWIHRTGDCEETPITLYQYTSSRARDHAKNFLEEFEGFLVSDDYAGYEKVKDITHCLWFSHLRQYYIEAIPIDSRKKKYMDLAEPLDVISVINFSN